MGDLFCSFDIAGLTKSAHPSKPIEKPFDAMFAFLRIVDLIQPLGWLLKSTVTCFFMVF